jgi:glucokinase
MKLFIDIGGTHLRSELHAGAEIHTDVLPTAKNDLVEVIEKKIEQYPQIVFVGISYAGQVNKGEILSAPNIVVRERKIKAYFESRYALRLEIDNDLNCAVMAEAEHYGSDSVAALYVGTGIGSAVIDGGRVMRGFRNLAGEIGHIPYRKTPFTCGCGKRNCIELYASGSGIERWMRYNRIDKGADLKLLKYSDDAQEREIAERFEEALLHASATLVTLANPKLLVLGGGVIGKNGYLADLIRERIGDYALGVSVSGLIIEHSTLENAAIEGAKLLEERIYG